MVSRVQQVYASRRKYGQASSIISILTASEQGTKEYQEWKQKELDDNNDVDEIIQQKIEKLKLHKVQIMLTIFRHQMGRLQLQRIVGLYPVAWERCAQVYKIIRQTRIEKIIKKIKINLHVIHVQRRWRHQKLIIYYEQSTARIKLQKWWRVWHQIRYRALHSAGTRIVNWIRHILNTSVMNKSLQDLRKTKQIARFMTRIASANDLINMTHHFRGWIRYHEEIMYNKIVGEHLKGYAKSLGDLRADVAELEKNDPTKLQPTNPKDIYIVNKRKEMREQYPNTSEEEIDTLLSKEFDDMTRIETPQEIYLQQLIKERNMTEEEAEKEAAKLFKDVTPEDSMFEDLMKQDGMTKEKADRQVTETFAPKLTPEEEYQQKKMNELRAQLKEKREERKKNGDTNTTNQQEKEDEVEEEKQLRQQAAHATANFFKVLTCEDVKIQELLDEGKTKEEAQQVVDNLFHKEVSMADIIMKNEKEKLLTENPTLSQEELDLTLKNKVEAMESMETVTRESSLLKRRLEHLETGAKWSTYTKEQKEIEITKMKQQLEKDMENLQVIETKETVFKSNAKKKLMEEDPNMTETKAEEIAVQDWDQLNIPTLSIRKLFNAKQERKELKLIKMVKKKTKKKITEAEKNNISTKVSKMKFEGKDKEEQIKMRAQLIKDKEEILSKLEHEAQVRNENKKQDELYIQDQLVQYENDPNVIEKKLIESEMLKKQEEIQKTKNEAIQKAKETNLNKQKEQQMLQLAIDDREEKRKEERTQLAIKARNANNKKRDEKKALEKLAFIQKKEKQEKLKLLKEEVKRMNELKSSISQMDGKSTTSTVTPEEVYIAECKALEKNNNKGQTIPIKISFTDLSEIKRNKYVSTASKYNEIRSSKMKEIGLDPCLETVDQKTTSPVSFLGMLKKVREEAENKMNSDTGIMGAVVPIRKPTKWHEEIKDDPLSVLLHVGYAVDAKIDGKRNRRNGVTTMIRNASTKALALHEERIEKKKEKRRLKKERKYEKKEKKKKKRFEKIKQKRLQREEKRDREEEEEKGEAAEKADQKDKDAQESKESEESESESESSSSDDDEEEEEDDEDLSSFSEEKRNEIRKTSETYKGTKNLLPQGTTAFIQTKSELWGQDKSKLRKAVRDLGIRHITEEQYEAMEASNYYDFTTIVPLSKDDDEIIKTHGEVYEAPMRKYCSNFRLGNRWQSRWFMVDSTKMRYWPNDKASSRELKTDTTTDGSSGGASYEYSKPSATYDLRCVETISVAENENEEGGGDPNFEFVIKFNKGHGTKQVLPSSTLQEDTADEGNEVRLRGPNRAIYQLWVIEISHRVFNIAVISALLKARAILHQKEEDERLKEEERVKKEELEKSLKEEKKQRLEARRAIMAHEVHREPDNQVLRLQVHNGHGFETIKNKEDLSNLFLELSVTPFDAHYSSEVSSCITTKNVNTNNTTANGGGGGGGGECLVMKSTVIDIPLEKDDFLDTSSREIQFCIIRRDSGLGKRQEEEENIEEIAYCCVDMQQLLNCCCRRTNSDNLKNQIHLIHEIRLPITHVLQKEGGQHHHEVYFTISVEYAPVLHDYVQITNNKKRGLEKETKEENTNEIDVGTKGRLIEITSDGICKIQEDGGDNIVDGLDIYDLQRLYSQQNEQPRDESSDETKAEIKEEDIKGETKAETKAEINETVSKEVTDEIKEEVKKKLKDESIDICIGDTLQVMNEDTNLRHTGTVMHIDFSNSYYVLSVTPVTDGDGKDDRCGSEVYTTTMQDEYKLLRRILQPKNSHANKYELIRRQKTTWETYIDRQSKRNLVVHIGWHDLTEGNHHVQTTSNARSGNESKKDQELLDTVEKRILPLHTNAINTIQNGDSEFINIIQNGQSFRNVLDTMELYNIEDNHFYELREDGDDYYDTSVRAPIQKRGDQLRPSNLSLLGPTWEGTLEKKASSNRFLRNDYQQRYFILDSQYLKYWNNEKDAKESLQICRKNKNKKGESLLKNGETTFSCKNIQNLKNLNKNDYAQIIPKCSIDLRSIRLDSIIMKSTKEIEFICLDLKKDPKGNTLSTRPPYILRASTGDEAHRWLKELQYRVRNIHMTHMLSNVWENIYKKDKKKTETNTKHLVLSTYDDSVSGMAQHISPRNVTFVRSKPQLESIEVLDNSTALLLTSRAKKKRRESFVRSEILTNRK